jgi:hypothetical protein
MATRGLLTYWSHSRADWAEGSSRPERSTVAGDKIVVFLQVRLPVENSDGWPEIRLAHVFTFHNGKAIHMRAFADGQQALAWASAARLVASNYPSRRMPQVRRLEANQELARRRQGWSPFVFWAYWAAGQNYRSLRFSQQRSGQDDFLLSTHYPLPFNSLFPLSSCPLCYPLPGNADPAPLW